MDIRQIRELVDLMLEKELAEIQLEQHGVSLRLRRPEAGLAAVHTVAAAAVAPAPASVGMAEPVVAEHDGAHVIRSPMVGTFYTAPEPGADPFVQVGDRVEEGQTLCIVEAMKLMNEITCDAAGVVVAVLQESGQPVEYGQELFALRRD